MEWVKCIDETCFVPDRDAVFADEQIFRMRNGVLLAFSRAWTKGRNPQRNRFFCSVAVRHLLEQFLQSAGLLDKSINVSNDLSPTPDPKPCGAREP